MNIVTEILNWKIKLSEAQVPDAYYIEVTEGKFYIYSENGYDGHGAGELFTDLGKAIARAKKIIGSYFADRGMDMPSNW